MKKILFFIMLIPVLAFAKSETKFYCDSCNKDITNSNQNQITLNKKTVKTQGWLIYNSGNEYICCDECINKIEATLTKYNKKEGDK